jgi:antitoxin component YwqK of YwqJK toxin-antitoxin module
VKTALALCPLWLLVGACTGAIETRTLNFENGRPWSVIQLKDGVPDGLWQTWFENGQKRSEGRYAAGKRVGPWMTYWENGQKQAEGAFENGRQNGPWTYWFESGLPASQGRLAMGVAEGEWVDWYGSGTRRSQITFREGQPDLVVRTFHPNGQLEHEWTYDRGILHGPYRDFREDGSTLAMGEYDHNQRVNLWLVYRADGRLNETLSGYYENGQRTRPAPKE